MDRHGALGAEGRLVPYLLIDLRRGIDAPRVAHQQQEDIVLNGGKAGGLAVHCHLLGFVVQDDAADDQLAGLLLHAPQGGVAPQLAADPGQDLDGVKGFGNVVVRPHVQAQHLVGVLALGGEEDDGDVIFLPQLGGGGDAVHFRHHDVHEDEMDLMLPDDVQGLPAGVGLEEGVVLGAEIYLQGGNDVPLVVADQNVCHGKLSHLSIEL